ncbi:MULTISPECIES: phosphate propanoyltransferase [Enterobacteriaceae]|uniref:Phosphate propanoyltransferase n=1 Tax=Raoultella lignicola TaxID=3040939 RepID=A0ABU9F4D1_9ENTR|nr:MULTISPECIES: phosphate propanoyltransferase [Enterobacteriaceae]MRT50260.1 phosphate propanoyltransferase [Raoultella sp. RIT712]QNK06226.1 phosphate propanoyltransferase [Enterobacter sp. JUb54]ROS08068.1 putative phosphotransacetylase [Raoultella sp. BIGb0399]
MIDTLLQEKISARLTRLTPDIPVGISNRHVHLSQQDVEALFGKGYALTPFKPLRQPGQFAAEECVTVVGPKGSLTRVRVLGPTRPVTQLEISRADAFTLGVQAPVRESGQLEQAGNALLIGPAGHVELQSQVICAWRHIHMSPQDAQRLNVSHGQKVKVGSRGQRQLTFDEVVVRVRDDFVLELHIDTEEANAAGLKNGAQVTLIA